MAFTEILYGPEDFTATLFWFVQDFIDGTLYTEGNYYIISS